MHTRSFDVVVVGAGLSGLIAALYLAKGGERVLVCEKETRAGGLCGTFESDRYEFTIAANDFGTGLETLFQELKVPVTFERRKTLFRFSRATYTVPFGFGDFLKLARYAGDGWRLWRAAKAGGEGEGAPPPYLGKLVEASVRHDHFADFLGSMAYPLGAIPDEVSLKAVKSSLSKEFAYGYDHPIVPLGGPRAMVEAMVRVLEARGGEVRLECEVTKIESMGDEKRVETSLGPVAAKVVVSSAGRWGEYPKHLKPGLSLSMFHVALRPDFVFPDQYHTLVHIPDRVSDWMAALDSGRYVEGFGFHLFDCELDVEGYLPINIYFYLPRGVDEPREEDLSRVESYIFSRLDLLLPGAGGAVLYKDFVSPRRFEALHHLSPAVSAFVLPHDFEKPDPYDEQADIYYVGSSVQPPGEHAGGAALSGKRVAERILRAHG